MHPYWEKKWLNLGVGAVIAVITFLVYLPSLKNGFVNWDDGAYVYENLKIRQLNFDFLKWAFTSNVLSLWHPLTLISYGFDYMIWGLNPLGYHLTNSILHALNASLVFVIVLQLMEYSSFDKKRVLIPGIVASLLFGIHPIHVESVAWISERKDVLCAFFFLLSLLSYVKYASEGSRKYYILSLVFFIFALMSKPMAVTLPFVFLLLDYYPFKRLSETYQKKRLFEKLPFFLLSIAVSIIVISVHQAEKGVSTLEQISFIPRIIIALRAYLFYLYKMILPLNLAPFYPYPQKINYWDIEYISSLISFLILCILVYRHYKRYNPLILITSLYYVITLLPVIGIIQVGRQAAADRYTYLPSLGPFILAGVGAAIFFDKYSKKTHRAITIASLILLVGILSNMTIKQIAIWRDSITLWTHDILLYPDSSAVAYENRGYAYEKAGQYNIAITDYNMAIKINGREENVYINRAVSYQKLGTVNQAIGDYNKAIEINPDNPYAYNNRGNTYKEMGNLEQSIKDYTVAIKINPNDPIFYINRGNAYSELGNYQVAIADYSSAIQLDPYNSKIFNDRGFAYNSLGKHQAALQDFDMTIELDPKNAMAFYNKGIAYHLMGNYTDAVNAYSRAVELNPRLSKAFSNRGTVYYILNNYERAISDYKEAVSIDPNDASAYYNLGLLYTDLGKPDIALSYLKVSANLGLEQAQDHLKKLGISW